MNSPALPASPCGSSCHLACEGARRALSLPAAERRHKAGIASLVALLVPCLGFPLALSFLARTERFEWLGSFSQWPLEFWLMAAAGVTALAGGLCDWGYHRWVARCVIGRAERRCELLALAGGGVPLFGMMCAASMSPRPQLWLLPVFVVVIYTTALICYDEFVYHRRRCRRLETVLHRMLVFGNGAAFLAWAHWCFVRGGFAAHA